MNFENYNDSDDNLHTFAKQFKLPEMFQGSSVYKIMYLVLIKCRLV